MNPLGRKPKPAKEKLHPAAAVLLNISDRKKFYAMVRETGVSHKGVLVRNLVINAIEKYEAKRARSNG